MKKEVDVVVVVPVGPNIPVAFVLDTLESYLHYTEKECGIILADDSHQGIGKAVQQHLPDVEILPTTRPMGGWAGLYMNEATAFHHALEQYKFSVLLKLDTDALIIAEEPEKEAMDLFSSEPSIGMAGQYPNDYYGQPWDIGWPRDRVLNGATTWKYIKRPIANWYLRKLYKSAKQNDYRAGESVFGGAYFMSYDCLQKLAKEGLLPHPKLATLNLGEDHIFSLLVKSVGFQLGTLSASVQPFALAWKGLPASPQELLLAGKKIIHSTRYWQDMNETDIRSYFKKQRETVFQTVS